MNQHTGNWPGKTVSNASGICHYQDRDFLLVDIPGTYSIMSHSEEEEIARDYICFGNPDATVVIVDATCLERNLNLVYQIMEITPHIVVCVNLLDEAKKKGIHIHLDKLEQYLGVPVVGTVARKKKTLKQLMEKIEGICSGKIHTNPQKVKYLPVIEDSIQMISSKLQKLVPEEKEYLLRWLAIKLMDREEKIIVSIKKHLGISMEDAEISSKLVEVEALLKDNDIEGDIIRDKVVSSILFEAENICTDVVEYENMEYRNRDKKVDKILTSKKFGIPIMIVFLGIILWITIIGANYPSQLLSSIFGYLGESLSNLFSTLSFPSWLEGMLIDGMYRTVTWVIAVMLPPMAIFFPMFTLLEDLGYLPRIAFNLDKFFKKACSSRKASINHVHGAGM